jgi:hypothetical protein
MPKNNVVDCMSEEVLNSLDREVKTYMSVGCQL